MTDEEKAELARKLLEGWSLFHLLNDTSDACEICRKPLNPYDGGRGWSGGPAWDDTAFLRQRHVIRCCDALGLPNPRKSYEHN